jgi:type I restriction enzyme S subunit
VNGRAFKPTDWTEDGLPIVRIQNLNDHDAPFNRFSGEVRERFLIDTGELLFSWSGTPGTSFGAFFWRRGRAVLNQHIFRVLVRPNVDANYFRYAINSRLDTIIAQAHGGVGLQHITKDKLEATPLPLPPLPEQRRIADLLDKADAVRRKRKEAIALTEELLRSAFLEMFGDPVTNPKGWPVKPLWSLLEPGRSVSYGVVQRGPEVDDGVPVIRISNFAANRFDSSGVVRTSHEIASAHRRTILQGGELMVSIRGTVGRLAIVPSECAGWNVSREVAVIPLARDVSRSLVMHAMLSPGVQRFMVGNVKGVAQSGINLEDLKNAPIPCPPNNRTAVFDRFALTHERLVAGLRAGAGHLDLLFDSLVQRAFRGELG